MLITITKPREKLIDIQKEFGNDILFLVEGVTKLGKLKYHGLDRHVESLRKFFIAVAQNDAAGRIGSV